MVVIPVRKRFGIELLLTMTEAIVVGLGSHGRRVPKVIARLVRARELHQNSLISVSAVPSPHTAWKIWQTIFLFEKGDDDLMIKLSLNCGLSCPGTP